MIPRISQPLRDSPPLRPAIYRLVLDADGFEIIEVANRFDDGLGIRSLAALFVKSLIHPPHSFLCLITPAAALAMVFLQQTEVHMADRDGLDEVGEGRVRRQPRHLAIETPREAAIVEAVGPRTTLVPPAKNRVSKGWEVSV
jgi:hypothetical protein